MKNVFRKNGGFTLVELLATMLTGSIITLAAVTILLMGVRINRQSVDTATRQMTARILLASLEDMASEGTITEIRSGPDYWEILGVKNGLTDQVLYSFDSAEQAIYSGTSTDNAVMEGVYASYVQMEGKLLTFSVETEEGAYTSSVYCRRYVEHEEMETVPMPDIGTDDGDLKAEDPRVEFLQLLATQYIITTDDGIQLKNPGMILTEKKDLHGNTLTDDEGRVLYTPVTTTGERYFSEWYIGSYEANPGWNPSTPWCACFVSWGLNKVLGDDAPKFANVDYFMNYLKNNTKGHLWKDAGYEPLSGDLIFFDWKINAVTDPEHVGAVIKVAEEDVNGVEVRYVYTIEGNSSNRVAIRKYRIDDPRIIGYGALDWPEAS